MDKVEPRITAFFALVSCFFLIGVNPSRGNKWLVPGLIGLQFFWGAMLLFSKETGLFLAAGLFATWACAAIFWPKDGSRDYLLKACIAQLLVVGVYFLLFKLLAPPMSYRYVSYSVSLGLIFNNAIYYFKSSPELALGVLSACYWSLRAIMPRLPGPEGAFRIALTFLSFSLLAYVAGIFIWRWPLDYYLLPAHFMVAALIPLTAWCIWPFLFSSHTAKKIVGSLLILTWLAFFGYRLVLGGSIYAFDSLKDDLAVYLSEPSFEQKRIVLPFDSPQSAEIGERLEFFIDSKRNLADEVLIYNFWEPPVVDKKNLSRFSTSAGISPSQHMLLRLASDPEYHKKVSIWRLGGKESAYFSEDISQGDIWAHDYLNAGDLILVQTGSSWYARLQTRGLNMHAKSPEEFMRRAPVALRHIGGVHRDLGPLWLGWDVFEVKQSPVSPIVAGYDAFQLRTLNEYEIDITGSAGRRRLFDTLSIPASAVLLGKGWHSLEAQRDEVFRWMGRQADILVGKSNGELCSVSLDVEPLIAGQEPFLLYISSGNAKTSYSLTSRQRIQFDYRSTREALELITLTVDGGVERVPGDPRTLKLRAFEISTPNCEPLQ